MTSYIIMAGPGFQDNARSPGQAKPHITWGAVRYWALGTLRGDGEN